MGLTRPRAYQIFDIDYKQSVRVVTVSNVTLGGGAPSVVDGAALSLNDRVLVTGQSTGSQNGLYYVTTVGSGSNGTWARSVDGNETGEIDAGMIIMVTEGNTYADTQWKLITNDPIIIGTTALTFVQNYMADSISAGTSNVLVSSNSNVSIAVAGANAVVFSSGTQNITANIIPTANVTYNLGNATNRFKDLYLSNNSIYLGNVTLSASETALTVNGATVVTSSGSSTLSLTGNITGGNVLTGGLISATGNITGGNVLGGANVNATTHTGTTVSVTANITGGNLITSGLVSATGAITGAAITGSSLTVTTGNITGGNLVLSGAIVDSAQLDIQTSAANANIALAPNGVGMVTVSTQLSAVGNVTGGNVLTGGLISATGNITGGNVLTGGLISATGNVTGGNVSATNLLGSLTTAAQANITSVGTLTSLNSGVISSSGNVTGANINTSGVISATGNITGGNISTTGTAVIAGFTFSGNTLTTSGATFTIDPNASGGIDGLVVINGNLQVNGNTTTINSNVVSTNDLTFNFANNAINSSAANGAGIEAGPIGSPYLTFLYNSTANVWTSSGGISAVGNITGGNVLGGANVNATTHTGTTVSVTANVTGGNILTSGLISATGAITGAANITGGNVLTGGLISATGNITGGNILGGANVNATTHTGTTVSVTANVTGGNILTSGLISATGNITGGNILGGANVNATTHTGTTVSVTANITGGNVLTGGIVSATGNITGGNVLTAGLISATGNITGGNVLGGANVNATTHTGTTVSVTANVTGGNVLTGGLVSSTGNVIGGNVLTAGIISATGNAFVGNILTNGYYYANGVVFGGGGGSPGGSNTQIQFNDNGAFSGTAGLTFNKTTNALATTGTLSATGNVTGGNVITPGLILATGNITGGNLSGTNIIGTLTTAAQTNITSVGTLSSLAVTGNTTSGNFVGTLNGSGANVTSISATNISTGTLAQARLANATVTLGSTALTLGATVTTVAGLSSVTSTTFVGALTGAATTAGTVTTAAQPNITSVGTLSSVSVAGDVQGGNLRTAGLISATGTVTGSSFSGAGTGLTGTAASLTVGAATAPTFAGDSASAGNIVSRVATGFYENSAATTATGWPINSGSWQHLISSTHSNDANYYALQLAASFFEQGLYYRSTNGSGATAWSTVALHNTTPSFSGIVNSNANGVGNIGSSTTYFDTVFAKATSAQYADLAEMYCADQIYSPGTVLEFGGVQEVTATTTSHSTATAGIVSTNPSYLMNSTLDCSTAVEVALVGRVPCQVVGNIHKGDRLVSSSISGVATVLDMSQYQPGCILGKALEDYNSTEVGIIEVAVGRF